eukprot:2079333-Rhodomonas_salina.2
MVMVQHAELEEVQGKAEQELQHAVLLYRAAVDKDRTHRLALQMEEEGLYSYPWILYNATALENLHSDPDVLFIFDVSALFHTTS